MSIAVAQTLEGMADPAHLHRVDTDDQVVIMLGSRMLFCYAATDTGMPCQRRDRLVEIPTRTPVS
ncbi:MAG TPA: hypothetical protein VES01_06165 [Dermatophilaceae bacterium]|nr:hypothetical protein [Dermatophilaceae bacterium]